jgi:hypothetical protein
MKFIKFILLLGVATIITSLSLVAEPDIDPIAELRQLEAAVKALEASASAIESKTKESPTKSPPVQKKPAVKISPSQTASPTRTNQAVSPKPEIKPTIKKTKIQKTTATPPKAVKTKEKLTPTIRQHTQTKENPTDKKALQPIPAKSMVSNSTAPSIKPKSQTPNTSPPLFAWISSTDLLFLIFLILICMKTPLITHCKSLLKCIQQYGNPTLKTVKTIPLNYIGLSLLIILIILLVNGTQSPPESIQKPALFKSTVDTHPYKLMIGSFHSKQNALTALTQFRNQGIDCFVKKSRHSALTKKMPLYQIQAGAFKDLSTAKKRKRQLQGQGVEAYIKSIK